MKHVKVKILFLVCGVIISGCQLKRNPAPVEVSHGVPGGKPYQLGIGTPVEPPKDFSPKRTSFSPSSPERKKEEKSSFPQEPSKREGRPDFIIVKQGETLFSIAKTYNMTGAELITLNNLASPYRLEVGQKVYLNASACPEISNAQSPSDLAPSSSQSFGFVWPLRGHILTKYGENGNEGINIAAPLKTPVRATQKGTVTYVGGDLEDFGNMVLISHENEWRSAYAHLDRSTVQQGDEVERGQVIGYLGQTGSVEKPQLHFELRKGADSVNPVKHLSAQ